MHRLYSVFIALVVSITGMTQAHADCANLYQVVTYHEPKALPATLNSRCDVKGGKCVKVQLTGYLYKPDAKSSGPHPILIANHGSEAAPSAECAIGKHFTALGYQVFVPIRRGHTGSTGADYDVYTNHFCSKQGDSVFCKLEYLKLQVDDVQDAIEFVKKQPGVAKNKIALIGHSFGGLVTLFANAKNLGQSAVVDIAGGSQSWASWEKENEGVPPQVSDAVASARSPIFFLEPMNDHSINPTISLARHAAKNCIQFQSALYPAMDVNDAKDKLQPDGRITEEDYKLPARDAAHGATMREPEASVWVPAVNEFIRRYLDNTQHFDKLCFKTSFTPQ